MIVEFSGFDGYTVWLANGFPVLEKITVELSGFGGDAVRLAIGFPVLEKTTVELSGSEDNVVCVVAEDDITVP